MLLTRFRLFLSKTWSQTCCINLDVRSSLGFKQVCSWLSTCFRHALDLLATCFRHAHASWKPGLQLARILECVLKCTVLLTRVVCTVAVIHLRVRYWLLFLVFFGWLLISINTFFGSARHWRCHRQYALVVYNCSARLFLCSKIYCISVRYQCKWPHSYARRLRMVDKSLGASHRWNMAKQLDELRCCLNWDVVWCSGGYSGPKSHCVAWGQVPNWESVPHFAYMCSAKTTEDVMEILLLEGAPVCPAKCKGTSSLWQTLNSAVFSAFSSDLVVTSGTMAIVDDTWTYQLRLHTTSCCVDIWLRPVRLKWRHGPQYICGH